MKKLTKKELNQLLSDLELELENKFKDNFTGLVLFGSYAKNKATERSDVDVLLTFKKLSKSRVERVELVEDFLNELELKYKISINPILKEEEELKLTYLFADIGEYAKIIYDKNKKINVFFNQIKKEYVKGFVDKIQSGDHYRLYVKNVI